MFVSIKGYLICIYYASKLKPKGVVFLFLFFVIATDQNHSQDLLQVVEHLGSLEEQEQRSSAGGAGRAELEEETLVLKNGGDSLHNQPIDSKAHRAEVRADWVGAVFFQILPRRCLLTSLCVSWQEEHSLLQLEEAIEALDANLELKNRSIQDRQKVLLTSDTSLSQLQSLEPVQLSDMVRKLEGLPPPEVPRLLARYFNRVRAQCTYRPTNMGAHPNVSLPST